MFSLAEIISQSIIIIVIVVTINRVFASSGAYIRLTITNTRLSLSSQSLTTFFGAVYCVQATLRILPVPLSLTVS